MSRRPLEYGIHSRFRLLEYGTERRFVWVAVADNRERIHPLQKGKTAMNRRTPELRIARDA
jgi:hypothetical protein